MAYAAVHARERRILRSSYRLLIGWLAATLCTNSAEFEIDENVKRKRMGDDIDDIIIAASAAAHVQQHLPDQFLTDSTFCSADSRSEC